MEQPTLKADDHATKGIQKKKHANRDHSGRGRASSSCNSTPLREFRTSARQTGRYVKQPWPIETNLTARVLKPDFKHING